MADRSKISWTDATWTVTTGCTHVSPGCDHCYAARLTSGRLAHLPAYAGLAVDGRFTGEVRLHPDRLDQPLRWTRPRHVFVCSMSDLFHDDVPDEFIARVFAVMAMVPQHTFQVLTKRPGRMRSLLNSTDFWRTVGEHGRTIAWQRIHGKYRATEPVMALTPDSSAWGYWEAAHPLPNVWLGVSVEDQHWAGIRIPVLLDTPAAVRFLSCEPLLGPVSFRWAKWAPLVGGHHLDGLKGIGWVIAGGESGPGARPMHPDWARTLRDQCVEAGVAYHFKQWGAWVPVEPDDTAHRRETDWHVRSDGYAWPLVQPHGADDDSTVTMRHVGAHAAGRILDGRIWDDMPTRPTLERTAP